MMMTNGVGATIGTLAAGEIVNHYCQWENDYLQGQWTTCWFIFATFALIVGVSFALVFHPEKKSSGGRGGRDCPRGIDAGRGCGRAFVGAARFARGVV